MKNKNLTHQRNRRLRAGTPEPCCSAGNNKTRIALIPAYEPGSLLIDLLHNVCNAGLTAIVIDDGSGEAFLDIFKQAAKLAVVLTHPENYGKGRAIKTGLRYIEKHFSDDYTVVTMDADGQHQVSDAVRICEAAERRPDALILGSRELRKNVPLRSRFGNTVTRCVYSVSTKLHVHDTQTGLRAFNAALIPFLLNIRGERYEYEMNVLLEFARMKIPIEEIEISTIYIDNNAGSHFDTVKDSYRVYKEIIKFSASSLVSFLVDYGLYSLLTVLTVGLGTTVSLTVSNVTARVISASANYTINRKIVFKSKKSIGKSALQYFALASAILVGNTFVLSMLTEQLGMNRYAAKLLTELIFFSLSWLVQRFFIFRKKGTVCNETN